jgi:hypothetical protein
MAIGKPVQGEEKPTSVTKPFLGDSEARITGDQGQKVFSVQDCVSFSIFATWR